MLRYYSKRSFGTRASARVSQLVVCLVALLAPAGASAAVTSISQGQGISLSPNPITSTGSVSLTLPLVLSNPFTNPFFSLTNTGPGDALDATGPVGVRAKVNGTGQYAVIATGGSGGAGVYAPGASGNVTGVLGVGSGTSPGVSGQGGSNQGAGGNFTATNGIGLHTASGGNDAVASTTSANGRSGIYANDLSIGGGWGGFFTSKAGVGVHAASAGNDAVAASTSASGRSGIYATNTATNGGFGGYFSSKNGVGLYARANPARAPAGFFAGNVEIHGALSVTGTKSFVIDDPRDPANKFLVHAADESPQAENVYNGNVTTDANGFATVTLPAYFDAENTAPRYQLTVIGSFAQAVVWKEEQHNQFEIRTNHGGVKVSWQVSAVRNDPWVRAHPQPTEQAKPASQRGRYLYPAGFGKPASLTIDPPH